MKKKKFLNEHLKKTIPNIHFPQKLLRRTNPDKELNTVRHQLLARAFHKHGQIKPCGNWNTCFTIEDNTLFFWYQSLKDNSSHLESQVLTNKN